MEEKKKLFIERIKNYEKRCQDCGEIFLSIAIKAFHEVGRYPIYIV